MNNIFNKRNNIMVEETKKKEFYNDKINKQRRKSY